MGRTNCSPAAMLSLIHRLLVQLAEMRIPLPAIQTLRTRMPIRRTPTRALAVRETAKSHRIPANRIREPLRNEPVPSFHSSPGRDIAYDVWRTAGRHRCLSATAGFGPARGGLSHDPGDDVLPRRRSHRNGVIGDCSLGATVRTSAGLEPDDLEQFARKLDHYAAVQSRSEH